MEKLQPFQFLMILSSSSKANPSWPSSASFLWPISLMLAITFASHFRVVSLPLDPSFPIDKLIHFSVFGLISTALIRAFAARSIRPLSAIIYAVLATSLFGLFDEIHQSFHPARFCSPWDLLADFSGALLAAFAYLYLPFYRNLLEHPLFPKSRLPSPASSAQIPPC